DGRFVAGAEAVPPGALLQLGAVQLQVVPPPPAADRAAVGPPAGASGTAPFNRPPRRLPPAPPAPVPMPAAPPEPAPGARFSWAMLLAPIVLGAVMAVIFQPVMAAFALFGPVLTVGTWWEDRRRVGRERRAAARQGASSLASFAAGLAASAAAEAGRRAEVLPDPAECLRRAAAPSTRVWERRPGAPDLLHLRLGVADEAWRPPVAAVPSPLDGVDEALAASSLLPRSPVEVDLSPGHTVGVVGLRPAVAALLRSLTCQAAVHHGPADLRLAVLTDDATAASWDWAKWLPHAAGLCAAGREAADEVASAWLAAPGARALLAIVDGDGFTEGRSAPVRDLLGAAGVGAMVVASSADRLPASCTTVVLLQGADGLARVVDPATGAAVHDVLVAGAGETEARRCARALAALDDPEAGDGAGLPDTAGLLGLLGLGRPTAEALGRRWAGARPASLAAVVGVGRDGPLLVDLVADGPHALLAGTTGAGKSELLRTLVASLAASYGPDHLTFVLVDYKGGSAFADCAGLPHVTGLVTDLDQHLGARVLRSLEAELRHRETVLAAAGAAAVDEPGAPALPRLVVVVDEFATMAAELPDFVDSLVGIAQRGRSLGVHLMLATQRPSGAVSDTIRANTNLRIALRVQDVPDSTDVIGTPQAAALDRRRPGRAYVRLGHAEVVPFQAAFVSGASPAGDGASVRVTPFVFGGTGATGEGAGDGPSDLGRLVAAARQAWTGPAPRRPWLDPLPAALPLDALPAGALGLADEPDAQRQVPFGWRPAAGNLLLYGMAGSGTSTALASLALALAGGGEAIHVYVVDFGGGALAPLAGLPAVGAVVVAGERERQERLVGMLRAELERRRAAVAAGRPAPWPSVALLVDNLGGLCAAFDDLAGMAVRDDLERLLADGPTLGLAVAATADRPGAVPASLASLAAERLVFRLADPYDDTTFGLPPAASRRAPGRAVHAGTGREVQMGLPGPLAEAVAGVAASSPAGERPAAVGVLPAAVGVAEVAPAARLEGADWFVPLGIGDRDLAAAGLLLGEGDHALVAGPARSGKSTVLCTMASVVASARPDVTVLAVAPRRSALRNAPGPTAVVTDPAEVPAALAALEGPALVLVDDADVLDDPGGALAAFFAARKADVRVVAAGRADVLRSAYGHWVVHVRRSRLGVALRPHLDLDGDLWHTVLPRHAPPFPSAGRGYLVSEGSVELFQAACADPVGVR
ncbi:MAG TPA: FtsK/SpoIIIE domain-containing protein, partial [Acidimicrobiales bacterium]|nr:FtsK/SpoIIIE domain-containing protein [Acidimicrobiales bacterium]